MKQITKDTESFVAEILSLDKASQLAREDIDNLASGFIHCDKNVVSAAKSLQVGRMNLDDFRDVANTATTSLSGFVAGIKSVAVNMAIFFAISTAIQLVAKGLDKLVTTQKEANEQFKKTSQEYKEAKSELESLNGELTTTNQRITELENQPSLSFIEQEELENLKEASEELRQQIEYNKLLAEQRQADSRDSAVEYFGKKSNFKTGYEYNEDSISNTLSRWLTDNKQGKILSTTWNFGTPLEQAEAEIARFKQLSTDIADVQKEIADLELTTGYEQNSEWVKATQELSAYEKELGRVKTSLTTLYGSFIEKDDFLNLEIEDDKVIYDQIQDLLLDMGEIGIGSVVGKSIIESFNEVWDSVDFKPQQDKLMELAKAGQLDYSILENNEEYARLLETVGGNANSAVMHINSLAQAELDAALAAQQAQSQLDFSSALGNLPTAKLEEYIAIANDDGFTSNNITSFEELNKVLQETGIQYGDLNTLIKEWAENQNYVLTTDLMDGIQNSFNVLNEVQKELESTGKVGLESLKSIASQYPELNGAIVQYNQGLISSEELINQLSIAYEKDADAYQHSMLEKLSDDATFFDQVVANNETLFTELGKAYDGDLKNYKDLAKAKAEVDSALITELAKAWSQYYDVIIGEDGKVAGFNFEGDESLDQMQIDKQTRNTLTNLYNQQALINEAIDAAAFEVKLPDFSNATDASSKGSSPSKDPKQEEIDWIARKNELLQKQHDIQEQIANDESASYNERKSALLDLIEQDKERASVAAQSASEYESAWNEVVSGLRATDVSKIIHGSLEIETYDAQELANQGVVGSVEEGEKYIENLKKAIELFDLKEEALLNHKEIEKESLEHQKESIRLLREEIDYQKDLNSAMASQVNSRMDLMEAEGKYITAGSYQELIRLSQQMESLHHDNINALYEQLELEKEGSAEYYDILAEIESVEDAIIQCQVEQENWNYQIARLPINRIQTYIDMLETIKQDAENWGAEVSVDGISLNMDQYQNLIDINAEKIDALIKQQEKLQDLLNKYDYGSDRFNELSEEIQSVQNQMSSLIQEQKEYNYAILEIPVREMSEQIENLASAKATLERSIAEDNEKGLATTISQYESLNQLTVQQLQVLSKQRDALTGLLSVYDENSDKYAETKDQLDNIDQTISDLVIQQYQWNSEILQIPSDKLEDLNNNLQTYSSILSDSLSEMDSVLSGVIGVIEQQTDAIEEQRKASEEMYDERIERIEKEKELLTSTNNDRKLQLDYEQALYDLDRAKSQKSIQVVRDGKLDYEADQDAIRDAQTAKADAEFNLVINNLEKQIEALETEKETVLEGYDEQLDKLDEVKNKWSEIADQIKQAADIAKADKFFGDGWADKVLLGTDSDIFNLFKDLYSSTSEQKDSINEQITSNERLVQMMGEFVERYKEGSLTYDNALVNISNLIQSMEGGYSALENLSDMMNLDNILGLENITTSTQAQIDKSAELLKQYMQIVESNKQSVEGFETNWDSMSVSVNSTIDAFNSAVNSIQTYLDVFSNNTDAINAYTSTWEDMKANIESQVEALKKAAEELEKLANTQKVSSGSSSSKGSGSGSSSKNGTYITVNGTSYLETSNGYVDKNTGNSGGSVAEVIGKYGSDKEKEDYYELRKNQISNSPQSKNEGWEKAALEALDEEMKKAGVTKYHDGIKNGPVDGKMSDDQLWDYARKIALDPLRADEVVKILQKGEGVFQPDQIRNVMQNSELVGRMSADASALGAVTNMSRNNTIDCSIGQVHLHEIKDVDEFAKAMKQTFASSMRQNFSEVFKK